MSGIGLVSVLIADDEPLARERLRRLLRAEPEFHLVGEAGDGPEAVRLLRKHHPEIAILDIRLPGLDAFGILHELGDGVRPAVIFVTAHTDRAADAFQAGAVDYLLKPFDPKRLRTALQRATCRRLRPRHIPSEPAVPPNERIALRSAGRWILLDAEDIEVVLSANIQCEVITRDGASFHISESLGNLAARLPSDRFLRVSRFTIVNLGAIRSIEPRSHGDQILELQSRRAVTVSRTHREEVLRRLKDLH